MSRATTGSWYVLAAAVLWGTTGTAQAFAPAGTQPTTIGVVRLAVGGIALLGLAAARGVLRQGGRWPIVPTALAAISMAAYQPLFFAGVARTGVAVGTIVAIGSAPALAGVLGFVVHGERPGRRWAAATMLAVLGCSLLILASGDGSLDTVPGHRAMGGIVLALGAGLSYAAFSVASKGLLEEHAPDAVMAIVFCLAALLLFPLFLWADFSWLLQPQGLAVALHLGLIATAAAYVLFARGLSMIPVATAITLSLAEPLTATVLGSLLLGERLSVLAILGSGLLLGGLVLLSIGRKDARRT